MSNLEIPAFVKYLWTALLPLFLKWHSALENKFKNQEIEMESTKKELQSTRTELKVLTERVENLQKTLDNETTELKCNIKEIRDLLVNELIK